MFGIVFYYIKMLKAYGKERDLEVYLATMENDEVNYDAPLEPCSEDEMDSTTYENLFQKIPIYETLLKRYNLKQVAGAGGDFQRALRVMQWLTDKTFYNGHSLVFQSDNSVKILKSSYENGFKKAINCRAKAIVLTDCLLALDFKAYPVFIGNDHVVVHVFCGELNKWVMLDPSLNSYFTQDDTPLNLLELRRLFTDGNTPKLNGYSLNGTQRAKEYYIYNFIRQNLIKLATWHDNSMDKRHSKIPSKRKAFNTRLPI